MWKFVLSLALTIATSVPAVAEDPSREDFTAVLVPIMPGVETVGAYGSRWVGELRVRNTLAVPVGFAPGYPVGLLSPCPHSCKYISLEPHQDGEWRTSEGTPNAPSVPGLIFNVEKRYAAGVAFSFHVRNLSGESREWGTEVPVVREESCYRERLTILNVPIDVAEYRATLRIYDVSPGKRSRIEYPEPKSAVKIALFPEGAADAAYEASLDLTVPWISGDDGFWDKPAYAEIPRLGEIPGLAGVSRIRIEVTPLTEGSRIWAMASVTNNQTQSFTLFTPQPK